MIDDNVPEEKYDVDFSNTDNTDLKENPNLIDLKINLDKESKVSFWENKKRRCEGSSILCPHSKR